MKKYLVFIIFGLFIILSLLFWILYYPKDKDPAPTVDEKTEVKEEIAEEKETVVVEKKKEFFPPIENGENRVTKKPFGIFITPLSSPVVNEKFTGFHTGTDFEVSIEEKDKEIVVRSICEGEILQVQEVSGYGGLIVQSCVINEEKVTVLYGHVNIESDNTTKIGDSIESGKEISILADENSRLSGFERKHLHLGIHKGNDIVYLGYVSSESQLEDWINLEELL